MSLRLSLCPGIGHKKIEKRTKRLIYKILIPTFADDKNNPVPIMAKKKKHSGHYCKVCGERKANEKFTGKGHARHICKECQSLPDDVKADMIRCNDVMRLFGKYPFSRKDWKLLEKYAKKYAKLESGQLAQSILDDRGLSREEEADEPFEVMSEPVPYADLEQYDKDIIVEFIAETVADFICEKDTPPDETDFSDISAEVREDVKKCYGIWVLPDEEFEKLIAEAVNEMSREMENIDELPF